MLFCANQKSEKTFSILSSLDLFLEMPKSLPITHTQITLQLPMHNSIKLHHLSYLAKVTFHSHYADLQTGLAERKPVRELKKILRREIEGNLKERTRIERVVDISYPLLDAWE